MCLARGFLWSITERTIVSTPGRWLANRMLQWTIYAHCPARNIPPFNTIKLQAHRYRSTFALCAQRSTTAPKSISSSMAAQSATFQFLWHQPLHLFKFPHFLKNKIFQSYNHPPFLKDNPSLLRLLSNLNTCHSGLATDLTSTLSKANKRSSFILLSINRIARMIANNATNSRCMKSRKTMRLRKIHRSK